jgi:glyoxylase-like metal-dependent hydrolase (beta-lactamase superfamily II)
VTRFDDGIVAIRYAARTESKRGEHFYRFDADCCCDALPIDYFVWIVATPGRLILLDAGFTAEIAQARGSREFFGTIADSIRKLGRSPDEVTDVVMSHLHYDHTGQLSDFPNSRIWVQQREWDFWHGPMTSRKMYSHIYEPRDIEYLDQRFASGDVRLIEGDVEIAPGVTARLLGGHTPGLQVLECSLGDRAVVLASDASHYYDNYERDEPYAIVDHVPSVLNAFDRIREIVADEGTFVPGHDPLVRERFVDRVNDDENLVLLTAQPVVA